MERYLDIEQPDDERQRKMIELMQKHPVLLNYVLIRELMEMVNETGDPAAELTLQAIQSGGLAGTPGRPKEPSSPEQPLGMPSATGETTPQEGGAPPPGQSEEAGIQREATAVPGLLSGGIQ
jgi:hypothetical protein